MPSRLSEDLHLPLQVPDVAGFARIPINSRSCRNPLKAAPFGSVDEEGYIYFSARSDDWLKHRGNRISPVAIENEACSLPSVVEASLHWREADDTLHLFVTVSEEIESEVILSALNESLEPAKVPEYILVLDEMPKSVNGKIDRKSLAAKIPVLGS